MHNIMYEGVASPSSMHNTGCLGLVHWDDPEGWYGEGGWRRLTLLRTVATCCAMIGEGGGWRSLRREEGTSEMSPRFLGGAV